MEENTKQPDNKNNSGADASYKPTENLNQEQAKKLFDSRAWEGWTYEQKVRFQLFEARLCMPFNVFHEAIEKVLERPVYTHEFGLNYEGLVLEYLGEKKAPTLEEIIDMIPEEKRIVVGL